MNEDLRNDVHLLMHQVYDETSGAKDSEPDEEEAVVHVHHFPDALLFVKERGTSTPAHIPVVESTPNGTAVNQASLYPAYLAVGMFLCLLLASILLQLYLLFHPPIATLTIIPKSQQITLTDTLHLGRVLNAITLSQSQTVPTTGHGHQDARAATGTITFYNGQFTPITIPAGTTVTGSDGVQVVTDEEAVIPAASPNPPVFGQVTVSVHATSAGAQGNISAYDINQTCCATSILVKNTAPFHGGQDERTFQTVTKDDINGAAAILNTTLSAGMQGALHGQVQTGEQLATLPCTPTVSADHRPGEEATHVTVTVSETCSAVAYSEHALLANATALLTQQAGGTAGTGYSLLGAARVSVIQASITHAPAPLVFVSFKASGTWVYALNNAEQQHIKSLITGRTKQDALHILTSQPGIASASLAWGDDTRLPKDSRYIHISLLIL